MTAAAAPAPPSATRGAGQATVGAPAPAAVAGALRTRRRLRLVVHGLLTALGAVAGTSVWGAMPSPWIIVLAALGAATALATFVVGARFRLLAPELFVAAVAGLLLVGGVAAGPLPTPDAYREFFRGLIEGWAVLLTSVPPVELTPQLQVIPYVGGWLATITALIVARRVRPQGLAVVAPVAVFGLGLLFSVETALPAVIHGVLLTALSLLTVAATRRSALVGDESWGNTSTAGQRSRLLSGAVVLAVAVGLAPVVADVLPGFDDRDRFDLRSRLEPPWDPLDEPSPLAQIKANYADEAREEVVFTAFGDDLPRRWTLATLGHFDGTVWTVGNAELGGQAQFVSIDATPPGIDPADLDSEGASSIRVEIESLDGPWLPTAGTPIRVEVGDGDLDGADPVEVRADNRSTTLAVPAGVEGLTYRFDAVDADPPTDARLATATVATPNAPPLELQASSVRDQAADLLEGVDPGWPQAERIGDELRERGFYRADETARPGHSWGRLADFSGQASLDGNEEQYAALAGVLARNADLPTRIVVGYLVPEEAVGDDGELTVTRDHASAWIEVHTTEFGWVPVDVIPDRDKRQDVADPGFQTELVTAPNPPPPPPDLQIIEPEQEEDEEDDEEEDDDEEQAATRWGRYAAVAGTAVGAPLLLGLVWVGLMVGLKARRRRARRRAKDASVRIVGAWHEANDRIRETGVSFPPHLTTAERAELLELATPGLDSMQPLVGTVERAAFASSASTDGDAERAWTLCDDAVADLKRRHTRRQRLGQAANPAPLLTRPGRVRRTGRPGPADRAHPLGDGAASPEADR
ncbi:MAG: transglutaminaseTgpA domain-containing protein [Actinomycetota bacterium]